ncbi:uncharacterized protein LOC117540820 [Gymnodraco acuticeps]|uniref:Uncharacterized protein LOC117540820 n=1 Tax=Gymnodraco acuticeps TaxID=8218 RepID=A0A6P8THV0_GYMAC|nr:uncharacterized protein LOC117540820 [Gymnodraco acuticeps]
MAMSNEENQEMNAEMNAAVNQTEKEDGLGKRTAKLTYKAAEAKILSMQKDRNSGIKQLCKMAKEFEQMMISDGNVSDMQIKHEMLWKLSGETTRLHESLKPLLPEDEMFKQTEWFPNQMHNVKGVIHKMEKWVHANREKCIQVVDDENDVLHANEELDNIGPNDSIGDKTNVSGGSSGHSRSSRSTTCSARIKAEAEMAALLALEAALKEKHELEAQEAQIRKKRELLEVQSQIAAQTAKVTVLRNRGSDIGVTNGTNSYVSKHESALKPSAVPFVPQTSSCTVHHPPTGGSKTAMSMKAQLLEPNCQYNHPPTGGSKTTKPTQSHQNPYNQYNPPTGAAKAAMPLQSQQLQDPYNQFNTAATMPSGTGARRKETISQGTRSKTYALNHIPSMPQRSLQSYPSAYTQQQCIQVDEDQGRMPQRSRQSYPTAQPSQQSNQNREEPDQGNIFTIMQKQNDITALLVQQQSSLSLPPRDIPVFDGNPLEYNLFVRAFENGVEGKAASSVDCLYYLEQYTRGQPRELVKSCQHMPSDRGYQRARMLLEERFGNEQKIATAYMEKALGWAPLKSEDIKAFQAFSLFLRVCCNAMEDISYMSEMNMPSNIRAIIMKLPYKLREKWRNIAFEHQERRHRQAGFSDLVNFIERQVSIASDPLYGDIQDTVVSFSKFKVGNKVSQGEGERKQFRYICGSC